MCNNRIYRQWCKCGTELEAVGPILHKCAAFGTSECKGLGREESFDEWDAGKCKDCKKKELEEEKRSQGAEEKAR